MNIVTASFESDICISFIGRAMTWLLVLWVSCLLHIMNRHAILCACIVCAHSRSAFTKCINNVKQFVKLSWNTHSSIWLELAASMEKKKGDKARKTRGRNSFSKWHRRVLCCVFCITEANTFPQRCTMSEHTKQLRFVSNWENMLCELLFRFWIW